MSQFIPSVQKSSMQFHFSFAYDAFKVWNELLDDIHSEISLLLEVFHKKTKL